jgi:hypothetical protein
MLLKLSFLLFALGYKKTDQIVKLYNLELKARTPKIQPSLLLLHVEADCLIRKEIVSSFS